MHNIKTNKKNQHFVPKFYLRQFSINNNDHQVGLFTLEKELYRFAVSLNSQGKEDYFYGEDGIIEDALAKLETLAAPIFKRIINTATLPQKTDQDYSQLFTFCLIMANRTKDAAEEIKEMTDKMMRKLLSYEKQFEGQIENLRIYPKDPASFTLSVAASRLHLAFDLKMKLIINKSTIKFITSDNPVILYNQFLEQRKHPGGHVGLAIKGLQMFYPISSTKMLCIYDEQVYRIGEKAKNTIEIYNKSDVEELNFLQVLNCFDHLYFNHDLHEGYVRQLYNRAKSKRLKEYLSLIKGESYIDKNGLEHIQYHSYANNLETNLQLSFITQTKKAKKYVLNDFVVQLRNESLRDRLK